MQVNFPLPTLLDYSLTHVKNLKERIQELEAKKEKLKGEIGSSTADIVLQAVKIIEKGPILEVNLETGLHKRFILPEVISILEAGGAQVLSASYATLTDRVLYTISSEVRLFWLSCVRACVFCSMSGAILISSAHKSHAGTFNTDI